MISVVKFCYTLGMITGNLEKLLKKYTSGWVVVSKDQKKVLAHGKKFSDVVNKFSKGYILKANKNFSNYVG
ncbi:hypothetical protein HY045_02980 [Candidatus Woesebacteria bacterium]|nr:hypothetical protein [Candidatus Woesebacteria bacterium]